MSEQYMLCTDAIASMWNMKQNKQQVDLIVTDAPYKITSMGCNGTMSGMLTRVKETNGKLFNIPKVRDWMPLLYDVLKDGCHCYIMCNQINLIEFLNVGIECGFQFVRNIIWDKGNKIAGRFYMSSYEYIIMFRKGKQRPINNCGTADILRVSFKKAKGTDGKPLHDTEKPVELMKILVANSSNEGELVLDPFAGIGTTGVACKELNRNFIGFEIEQKYCDVANQRLSAESSCSSESSSSETP